MLSTPEKTMDKLLEIKNLSVSFNNGSEVKQAVKNVSIEVKNGEIIGIVGESGSGKSVTAQSILGLLPKNKANTSSESSIIFNNQELIDNKNIQNIRGKEISYIFQEPLSSLNPLHTIGRQITESILVHQNISKTKALRKAVKLLNLTGIHKAKERLSSYPHELSGGQRQRVMIAMAIANEPKLLIADEPTTAIDVTIQAQVLDLLLKLRKQLGMSIIFISHDLNVINKISDKVYVMHNGQVVENGITKDVFSNPQHDYTKTLTSSYKVMINNKKQDNVDLLRVNNINVFYPKKKNFWGRVTKFLQASNNVSFNLKTAQTLGIVGESGSGKSTIAAVLTRLIPFSGKIWFDNQDISKIKAKDFLKIRKNIQIVFQDPFNSLNPRMNIQQIIGEGLDIHFPTLSEEQKLNKIIAILQEVGLDTDVLRKYPHEFSGGQRQRIAIARSLILEPKLLILDEPTSALDATIERQILKLLHKIQATKGISYIFISHNIKAIKTISDDIAVMKDGKIIEIGTREQLFENPKQKYTKELLEASQ